MIFWKKFWKRWGKVKNPTWIYDLPEGERKNVRRVRSLLVMIGDFWVLYPLWTFIGIALSLLFLIMQVEGFILETELTPWKVGLVIGILICLIGIPLSKLIFLKYCKRLLLELKKEIETNEGWYAYKLIKEKESSLTQITKSADRRYLLDWFSLLYHYTNLDYESRKAKRS